MQRIKRDFESGRLPLGAPVPAVPLQSAPLVPRAARAIRHTKRWLLAGLVVLLAIGLLWGGFSYRQRQRNRLGKKDTFVLADFSNSTGDPNFDDTLKTALSLSLGQSPFLNALPNSEITNILQQMTMSVNTRLTSAVARELCQRAGSKVYIAGSIGSLAATTCSASRPSTASRADTLAQEQVTVDAKEKVLNQLGEAATRLRGKLGESLASIQRFDRPILVPPMVFAAAVAGHFLSVPPVVDLISGSFPTFPSRITLLTVFTMIVFLLIPRLCR